MHLTVVYTIGRTRVARGNAYSNTEKRARLERFVHTGQGLVGPAHLRGAPADRYDTGLVMGIMHSLCNGIQEALIGIRGKIHYDLSARCSRSGYFYIQHYLAVGAVGIGRTVFPFINRHSFHAWLFYPEAFEIFSDVSCAVSAT